MTTWLPWVLAAGFAILSLVLALRPRPASRQEGVAEVRRSGSPAASPAEASVALDEAGTEAIQGLFRYVEHAVLAPLRSVEREDLAALRDAIHALEDLAFHARAPRAESVRTENLGTLLQAVAREFALDTGIRVKVSVPEGLVTARVAPESFKDALYLLLANAGHFGKGTPIEVRAEPVEDRVRITVRDQGPGFSLEALERAFRPFWTSERDALGLGLTRARETFSRQSGTIGLRNAPGGGAEVEVTVPRGG